MSKMLSLIAGISALALAGIANAGGPVTLTSEQMDVVTAGGSAASLSSMTSNSVNFTGTSNISDAFTKTANIKVKSYVIGNSASLAFDNAAVGRNSNSQGTLSQETVAGQGSTQSGLFGSAAGGRNSASLAFDSQAFGRNSNSQGTLSQETVAGQGSSQSGLFVSAAGGRGR